jgi:toxin ParE1/3/4
VIEDRAWVSRQEIGEPATLRRIGACGQSRRGLLRIAAQARRTTIFGQAPRVTRAAPKPLHRRACADADVLEAVDHGLAEAPEAAAGPVDALEAANRHILRAPGTGSPRYAHELNLPGLRCRVCSRDPYLIFYIEPADCIEVWPVLHARRDIHAWLQNDVDPVGGG